jgi:hypothetical protein
MNKEQAKKWQKRISELLKLTDHNPDHNVQDAHDILGEMWNELYEITGEVV